MGHNNQKLVVVMGMHRSGTSMMSGILTKLGLFPGREDRLLKPDEYNQHGYFEDNIIVECNEQILADAVNAELTKIHDADYFLDNNTLDGFGWLYGAWLQKALERPSTPKESMLIKESLKKYKEGLSSGQICLIKDPRMSLTLKKWSEEIKISAAIVMLRNPVDVAQSLYKRDMIIEDIAYNIWQLYTFKALLAAENIPHIIIDYDRFLDNKEITINEIVCFLKVVNYIPNHAAVRSALEFVEMSLNHSSKIHSFRPSDNILEIYNQLKDNRIKNLKKEYSDCYEKIKDEWQLAMYLAVKRKGNYVIGDLTAKYKSIIDRLNRHIIVGNLIKIIRKIKKDPTFGTY